MGGNAIRSAPAVATEDLHRWAVALLGDQGMPPEEIATMLDAEDPQLVHRLLDLHRERLEERLIGQRRIVDLIEVPLTEATGAALVREGA